MLRPGKVGRIFLSPGATDMRKFSNGLSGLVRSKLAADPLSGDLFVFCYRPRRRLEILYFDTSGMSVFAKRLERGTFAWPANALSRLAGSGPPSVRPSWSTWQGSERA